MTFRSLGFLLGLTMLVTHACGGDAKPTGSEGGSCYGNGTCDPGLSCLSQLCVTAPDGGGAGTGAGGTASGAGGTAVDAAATGGGSAGGGAAGSNAGGSAVGSGGSAAGGNAGAGVGGAAGSGGAAAGSAGSGGTSGGVGGSGGVVAGPKRSLNIKFAFTNQGSGGSPKPPAVTSMPAGIACGGIYITQGGSLGACDHLYDNGTSVMLTAQVPSHLDFTGWSGDCVAIPTTVTIAMDRARTCTANYAVK